MAEDVADVGQRHARVVEMHRPAVAQDVRAQLGAGERRVGCLGLVFAEDPGDPAAAEFRLVLVEEHRAVVMAGPVEVPLGEVGGQQRRRVRVDRDVPRFAAFAGQRDDRGVLEPDVPDFQIGGLLDAGGGVVEGRQQGRVTPALAGGRSGRASSSRVCSTVRCAIAGWSCLLEGIARMSWQHAIRAGSWVCIQRK